jgi:membrane protein required for colicin V production
MPSYLDLAVIVIVLISGFLALMRGFTREVLAILSWVAAAAAAYYFHPLAMPYVKPYVPKENIALAVSAGVVFLGALVVVSIFTVKLSDVILDSKIGALDRTLGFVFGAFRGLLLAVVAFVFYNWLVPETGQPEWVKTARAKPVLQSAGDALREYLPDDVDSILAKIKAKGSRGNEEQPPEEPSDAEQAQPAPAEPSPAEAEPEKKSDLLNPPAANTTYAVRLRFEEVSAPHSGTEANPC